MKVPGLLQIESASPTAGPARPAPAPIAERLLQPLPLEPFDDRFASAQHRSVSSFGTTLTAIGGDISNDHRGLGARVLDGLYHVYDKSPLTHLLDKLTHTHDTENAAELRSAEATPLAKGANGQTASFGDVTVMVNGLLNLNTTPAMVFRMARYTRGPLVIASSNATGPDGLKLRPMTEIWGHPVPPDLRGKIWMIGDQQPNIIPWTDGSDLLLEQLDVVSKQFGELKKATALEADSLESADLTMVGYSQGVLSAMAARKRLNDAGKSDVIDHLISVSGALAGTPFAQQTTAGTMLSQFDHRDGRRAMEANSPEFIAQARARLGLSSDLIDLAYGASIHGSGQFDEPFFKATGHWLHTASDGVVPAAKPGDAKRVIIDSTPKTHLMVWKDWRTADVIAQAFANP